MPIERKHQFNLWYFVIAVFAILMFQSIWQGAGTVERIPYSEFQRQLEAGNVAAVMVGSEELRGDYITPHDGKTSFVTQRVDEDVAAALAEHGVDYAGAIESTWFTNLLSWVLPVLLFFGLWMFFFRKIAERQGMGGLMSVGRSRAKVYVEKDTKVSFDDVAGVDKAKAELAEIVEFLRNPEQYGRLGARIPKGILLVGPPGTGKTLLARAVAGEAGVTFFSISGAEFVEMFVGVSAARVRDLFEQARAAAPAIIFIDELDALGRARGAVAPVGGHDEREQTLNQLLNELDGFDPSIGVALLAATNRPEILDPALLRAGRFDRQVLVDKPDRTGRVAILKVHMKKAKISTEVDPDTIAGLTTGFTGADLANLINEAALLATRRKAKAVEMEDCTNAIERIIAGLEKRNRLMNPKEREIVAFHEMGHALVSLATPGTEEVHKVSIIPRLVTRYGMDEELGHAAFDRDRAPFLQGAEAYLPQPTQFSEATAERIDAGVKEILDTAFAAALKSLETNRKVLDRCAAKLLETETLDEARLRELTEDLQGAGGPSGKAAAEWTARRLERHRRRPPTQPSPLSG